FFDVLGPAVLTAHGVDQKSKAAQTGAREHLGHHLNHFRIDKRRFRAYGLRADLKKLTVPALLRAFAAKHGPDVVKLLHAGSLIQTMLDVSAYDGRRVFGAQDQARAVTILKRVHLFGNNVSIGADATREKLLLFKNRRADFLVIVGAE